MRRVLLAVLICAIAAYGAPVHAAKKVKLGVLKFGTVSWVLETIQKNGLDKAEGIELDVWRVHRRIGMSGGLLVNALLRETGREMSAEQTSRLQKLHADRYAALLPTVRPLAGARDLLGELTRLGVPWAIATSGRLESAGPALKLLGVSPDRNAVVTRDQVPYAKPDPDLFLAAPERIGMPIESSVVVGDSVWDLAGGAAGAGARRRRPLRRLRAGRARTRRRVSRVRRSSRPARAPRRGGSERALTRPS